MIGAKCGQRQIGECLLNDDERNTGAAGGLVHTIDHGPKIVAAQIRSDDADWLRMIWHGTHPCVNLSHVAPHGRGMPRILIEDQSFGPARPLRRDSSGQSPDDGSRFAVLRSGSENGWFVSAAGC